MPEYVNLLDSLKGKGTSEWASQFKDWNFMSLREDIAKDNDYVIVSNSSWLKLVTAFGGSPEIPIYQYFVEKVKTQEDGSQTVEKTAMHDFRPIRINLTAVELKTQQLILRQKVLASPFLTNKFFVSQVIYPCHEMSHVTQVFVVRPYSQAGDELPVIYKLPDNTVKLFECGIQEDAQVVVITDLDKAHAQHTKQAIHLIGKMFDIPTEETQALAADVEMTVDFKPEEVKYGESKV